MSLLGVCQLCISMVFWVLMHCYAVTKALLKCSEYLSRLLYGWQGVARELSLWLQGVAKVFTVYFRHWIWFRFILDLDLWLLPRYCYSVLSFSVLLCGYVFLVWVHCCAVARWSWWLLGIAKLLCVLPCSCYSVINDCPGVAKRF